MDRQARHRGIEGIVVKRQRLRAPGDRRRGISRPLSPHDGARLDRENPAIGRLVGAGAGADVEHGARIPERGFDPRGDPLVCAPGATRTCSRAARTRRV